MANTPIKTIRIPPYEVEEAMAKGATHKLTDFTAVVRFALKRLRSKQPK